eukprot:79800-Pleurochrysis_carterae.AAC.1
MAIRATYGTQKAFAFSTDQMAWATLPKMRPLQAAVSRSEAAKPKAEAGGDSLRARVAIAQCRTSALRASV